VRPGRRGSFDGNRRHLLRDGQMLGRPARQKLDEAAQNCQPVIPRAPVIVSCGLEVLQETQDAIERKLRTSPE